MNNIFYFVISKSEQMKSILFIIGIVPFFLFSQQVTISGYIEDEQTGEKLIGASIFELKSKKGTTSNTYGFYSITLPSDSLMLQFSYVGYTSIVQKIESGKNVKLNIRLKPSIELKEFEVTDNAVKIEQNTQMSTIELQMDMVKSLPVLLGEKDILKTIQLLPGVQSGSEGSSGIYVRGGGPDQNLILLDGVPVYNASHLFGFFSIFNTDAINSVELIKGGFPSRYGGRLSSVIDIRMKEGNMKEIKGEGSVGLISSKFTLEGPIKKDKTSFIVSGRRTYIDLLAKPLINKYAGDNGSGGYFFYDFNTKLNHKFSDKSRLYISNYLGDDKFYAKTKYEHSDNNVKYESKSSSDLKWGNIISALRWNYQFNDKLFSNTTLTYSRYRFNVGFSEETTRTENNTKTKDGFSYDYFSGIYDWGGKIDFYYIPHVDHYMRFGAGETYHTFTPGVNQIKMNDTQFNLDTTFGSQKKFAHEFFAYLEDDFVVTPLLKVNVGVHTSGFMVSQKTYTSLQPRVSLRYLLSEHSSVKASYSKMTQFIHLLSNSSIGLPTDLWLPVTDTIKPLYSNQFAMGYAHTFKSKYSFSVEAYYKNMQNIIEYKEGASFLGTDKDWQQKVEMGKGWAYGIETFIEKKTGKTTGWVGYTLSWSNRQFENLNFGKIFPYRYDRRHDVGIAVTHWFNEKVDVGIVWVYGTGNAVTLGMEKYQYAQTEYGYTSFQEIEHITERNNYRIPAYHRLDMGVNMHKKKKLWERTWSIGVYNIYNRKNPFYIYFSYNNHNERVLKQISLFPLIPSFTYSFKF
ncbi:Ferrienterobactin receptor [Flavobacteriales bacterium]|nr:Vitamin B12 transporter BtuB [Flavobacteriales bacterium]CAG0957264.1 Ferrienterobactin receptor [Flavobacteriales bacterium]